MLSEKKYMLVTWDGLTKWGSGQAGPIDNSIPTVFVIVCVFILCGR